MPTFSYRALGRDGKEVRGVLQAETETAAATRVRDSYPVLLSISREAEKKKQTSLLQMEIGNKRIRTKDLSILCSQFAITLRSGMSISRSMQMLAGQCGDKRLRRVMAEAATEVAAGSTVAAALEKHRNAFRLPLLRRSGQANSPVPWTSPLNGCTNTTTRLIRLQRKSKARSPIPCLSLRSR